MSPEVIFQLHLVLGYVAALLLFGTYLLPKLGSMGKFEAQRVIATIHSFRFFGLVFMLPGFVGPHLPASFATFAAYGDLAAGMLAITALLVVRMRSLFWLFVAAYNLVGVGDLVTNYYHAMRIGLPEIAGELGSAYAIPIIYVPILLITHVVSIYWLVRPQSIAVRDFAGSRATS